MLPDGILAVTYEMPWGSVLRVVSPRAGPSNLPKPHEEIDEDKVEGFCYAMGQCATVEQKETIYRGMMKHGLIRTVRRAIQPTAGLKEFCDLLRAHDWTFEMSDDGRAYRSGKAEQDTIKACYFGKSDWKALYDEFNAHVFQRGPKPELPA